MSSVYLVSICSLTQEPSGRCQKVFYGSTSPRSNATLQTLQNLGRFGSLCVVRICRCVKNRAVAVEDVCRRYGQLPTIVSVGKRQIDESPPVELLLILRYTVH